MSPTTFWSLGLAAPALLLVALRVRKQGLGHRLSCFKQLAFRAALSVLTYLLYFSVVRKYKPLWPSDDFESAERFARGLLFWMLYYWSAGTFDRETWRA